ncbi:hypothetical protein HUA74_43825 [Myxococcus sp. CA051A]|uniref:Uncharacterized protein n=2 Tax=Myxococcaceae TaxID=31 RepID=A0A540WZ96_9BACT|nr:MULTISPECIES: hypothetical protein [unclassified Myxococcus]NTX07845.1 hypothetical protein [Myxococcus sp. CA040A]NTX51684.1 hypothetical protein [Myxococcus sp. CA039A]NTX67598.1 hypothetical protein [Myxococcus sp. CA051A]TQF14327.1 hypothetical protein FJV41_19505 [Myxococcus llanfairpwllgwyngyllgogerychwyrndrobwllllantysiliogogogochensis]NTX14924.1 hypothetical protein [Myxococcus sp. CA056]
MSDGRKSPRTATNPGTQPRTPSSPGMPRTPTDPGTLRVMSAARTAPLQKGKQDGALGQRLAGEASNQALNALSILKEFAGDFRQRDRFFKYKASIVAGWLALTVASFAIACPGSSVQTGDMDARLVLSDKLDRPSITIWNESKEAWKDVTLIVNGQYRAAVPSVGAGEFITITPKQLMGTSGAAPADLRFNTLEMRSSDDSANLTEDLLNEWKRLLGPK